MVCQHLSLLLFMCVSAHTDMWGGTQSRVLGVLNLGSESLTELGAHHYLARLAGEGAPGTFLSQPL